MDGSEFSRNRRKRGSSMEDDGEDSDGLDKRKHRSSKSRKCCGKEDPEEHDSGRRESSKEKDYKRRREEERDSSRGRSDDASTSRKEAKEISHRDTDNYKHGNSRERSSVHRNDSAKDRSRVVDSSGNKDRRADGERSHGRSDAEDEDKKGCYTTREVREDKQSKLRGRSEDVKGHRYGTNAYGDKAERHRRDAVESRDRSINLDEDRRGRVRDRSERGVRAAKRSRTPERSGRYYKESYEHDRGSEPDIKSKTSVKGKERETDSYQDDRSSKGKDNWENSKNQWRRGQYRQNAKERDNESANPKEWERSGYRKDSRNQAEAATSSADSGIMAENSATIEIRPAKNSDFRREESVSTFSDRRVEASSQQDFGSGDANGEEWVYPQEVRYQDNCSPMDQRLKGAMNFYRTVSSPSFGSGLHPPYGNNHASGPFNWTLQQGQSGGSGRPPGRDLQRVELQVPVMGPPFGPLGVPPGPIPPIGPQPAPGIFIPPFPGHLGWRGPRGVDMNMFPIPPNLPCFPPPLPARSSFGPNIATGPNPAMYYNQPGPGRGLPAHIAGPGFNPLGPIGLQMPHDNKPPNGFGHTRNNGIAGKAPSRGEQNDYSQNFVDTGMRPQNFIRELELTSVVEDYPKLRELIQRKDEIVVKASFPPMYYKCDLREHVLSSEFFGTKFDVILVDPPWEEYVLRASGVSDPLESWTFEEIQNLKIEAIADNPSFIFLWVGDGVGLEQGRQCLKKWGFRRCEDICWLKTNKRNATPGLRHDSHTLVQHSKEHCLMGIKGTVRRSTDGHIIHANIDTDIIIAEEPSDGSTKKPDDMYRIIEHFALGKRRLELFGEDHNIRSGWLTVGSGLSSSNFNAEAYIRNFADKDGKVWQGGSGRNPHPGTPHLVETTPEIENLRPKSPPSKSQQQQSAGSYNTMRAFASSPQSHTAASLPGMNQDMSGSDHPNQFPCGPGHDARFYDVHGFNAH